jgi:hypothetical protein
MTSPPPFLTDPDLEEFGDRLTRALERYAKRLRPTDLDSLVDAATGSVLQNLRNNIAADSVAIWIADQAGENLVFAIASPVDNRVLGREQPMSEGFISLVFASEQPICENRVAEDERHSKRIDSVIGETTEAIIAVPFYLGGVLRGVLSAVRWQDGSGCAGAFGLEHLQTTQRASVVVERLINLALAKAICGIEL